MADPPRKRVSTSYKRYVKEHTGKEGVSPRSKRAFLESYSKVISHMPSSPDAVHYHNYTVMTESQQTGPESGLFEDEVQLSQYYSGDDMNHSTYHATSGYSGDSEANIEGDIVKIAKIFDGL